MCKILRVLFLSLKQHSLAFGGQWVSVTSALTLHAQLMLAGFRLTCLLAYKKDTLTTAAFTLTLGAAALPMRYDK